jgi:hypothetical protein
MSSIKSKKPLLAVFATVLLIATIAGGGYFYSQQNNVKNNTATKIAPVTAKQTLTPTATEALTDLFGTKTGTDKINSAPDELTSIWFAQSFNQKADKFYVVFTKTQTIDPETKAVSDGHATGVSIGAVVYQQIAGKWQLYSKQTRIAETGSWGDAPNTKQAQILELSPGNLAFLIEAGGTGQGYTEEGKAVFGYTNKTWKDLGFVQTYGDNAGACDDSKQQADSGLSACWEFSGEITVTKTGKNPAYPDLLVLHQGTTSDENNKIIPVSNSSYFYNGEQYIKVGAEAL